jgi:hypothetical protein
MLFYAIGRDGYFRGVGMEIPIGVIEVTSEVVFDILWDIRNGLSVTKVNDVRQADGLR